MADSTDILDNLKKLHKLPNKSDWKKTRNLKKKMNPPLRKMDEFSEEEKRTIVENNVMKKMGPKLLGKEYHTSQYVIHRFVKSAGFQVFQPQISQKQERILQERQKRFQDLSEGEKSLEKCKNSKASNHQEAKLMEKFHELYSRQKRFQDLSVGEKMANIEENTEQLKGPKLLKRKKGRAGNWFCQTKACIGYLDFELRPNCQFCNMPKSKVNPNHLDELLNYKKQSYKKSRNISVEDNRTTTKGQKSLRKCQNSKTSNHQDQTFPPLSLRNMIVLDEWNISDSEPKNEILVKTEPQIIDQNCFQDMQQPDSGSEKQPEIKKEPVLELEPESNLPIKMNKGFVFPKPVPSVIPVVKNEPLLDYTTT